MMNSTTNAPTMTLWDAYRLANRRGARLDVELGEDSQPVFGFGGDRSLRVGRSLVNGHVAVQRGLSADWTFVPMAAAKTIAVTRCLTVSAGGATITGGSSVTASENRFLLTVLAEPL